MVHRENQIAVVFLIFFLSVITCSVFSRFSFHFIILIRSPCYIWPYLVKQHSLSAATSLLQVQLQCNARVYLFCPMVTEPELTPLAAPLHSSHFLVPAFIAVNIYPYFFAQRSNR